MRVAVIGSAGQLGSDLIRVLYEAGSYDVVPLSRAELDVTDRQGVEKAIVSNGLDAVVNCAAFTRVEDCEDEPARAFLVNAQGALEIARACAHAGALCVYISTDYVFDGEKGAPYAEDDAVLPVNVYGVSKLAGEFLVRQAASRWLIVRLASLFGARGSRAKGGNFVETVLARARAGLPLRVVNDITMSPTYTRDAAHALEALIRSEATGVYHGANAGHCTWFEFAAAALELAGVTAEIGAVGAASYPAKARRPKNSSLDTRKLTQATGFSPRPWKAALRAYLIEKDYLKT
ncbi:MAG TPA: dTDP-4-dehydrorhamnose reductase [Candidatus Acidoferrales bacterium]|nr:dTDP-4-dehydrorhamnose reductase [Candidatus Acidoferrales bacterium]